MVRRFLGYGRGAKPIKLAAALVGAAKSSVGSHHSDTQRLDIGCARDDIVLVRVRLKDPGHEIERKFDAHEVGQLLTSMVGVESKTAAYLIAELGDLPASTALAHWPLRWRHSDSGVPLNEFKACSTARYLAPRADSTGNWSAQGAERGLPARDRAGNGNRAGTLKSQLNHLGDKLHGALHVSLHECASALMERWRGLAAKPPVPLPLLYFRGLFPLGLRLEQCGKSRTYTFARRRR
jgi:hypothetical protein